jgi:hypothetical protein
MVLLAARRGSDVVGIYPTNRALIRLAGMLLIELNDERVWESPSSV